MMRTWRKYVEESIFKWCAPKKCAQGNLVNYFAAYSTLIRCVVDTTRGF